MPDRTAELEPAERTALDHDVTVRRGQGSTPRVSTAPCVHRRLLARCRLLDSGQGAPAVPAQRKARHEYANRVSTLPLRRLPMRIGGCGVGVRSPLHRDGGSGRPA
ncbi:hypothetical protein GCM10010129_68020 [Streptomyces fumigatiscleroticus]|nr:hypothetical protein GCM10010129_68020 [Streptomyces fumigatiscleroticus]